MDELKQQFKAELKKKPQINFLEEFKKGRKSSVNRHFSYYVMRAFLSEEIIKKKGFEEVLKLVYSGSQGDLFFENLKEILHIRLYVCEFRMSNSIAIFLLGKAQACLVPDRFKIVAISYEAWFWNAA